MKCRRGDVVLLDYPFSDGSGSKVRPALVIQADVYNAKLTSTVVALVTKNTSRAGGEPTQLLIDPATPDGSRSRLLRPSAVTCCNLYTVHEHRVLRVVGHLRGPFMTQVN